mmetsp:Transcript_49554/g.152956  ORF Transcript_49554/g.152956 Transcript_49554/m.152956 type:complete len:226 (-) Transcript_49554:146-823(-)
MRHISCSKASSFETFLRLLLWITFTATNVPTASVALKTVPSAPRPRRSAKVYSPTVATPPSGLSCSCSELSSPGMLSSSLPGRCHIIFFQATCSFRWSISFVAFTSLVACSWISEASISSSLIFCAWISARLIDSRTWWPDRTSPCRRVMTSSAPLSRHVARARASSSGRTTPASWSSPVFVMRTARMAGALAFRLRALMPCSTDSSMVMPRCTTSSARARGGQA